MGTVGGVTPITPFLPTCSAYTVDDFTTNFATRGVAFNLSDSGNYVYDKVVPSLIPGIVLGALCLLGFFFWIIWLLVGCCCACCACCGRKRSKKEAKLAQEAGTTEQFISQGAPQGTSYAYPGPSLALDRSTRLKGWRGLFWVFYALLSLAVIGVSAWGLAESIELTNFTVSDFWGLVDGAQYRVEGTITALQQLQNGTTQLGGASTVLGTNTNSVVSALQAVAAARGTPLSEAAAQNLTRILVDAPAALQTGSGFIQEAVDFLQLNVNDSIASIEADFKPPTMAVQETWRFIPIAVIFGVTILLVALLLPAVWKLTWPRAATALLVALLWLAIALLMLLGTGLLNGVHVVSSDACLFAETFAVSYAARRTQNSQFSQGVTNLLLYYTGNNVSLNGDAILPPGSAAGNAALQALEVYLPPSSQVAVANVAGLLQNVSGATQELAATASDPALQSQLSAIAGPQVAGALQQTGVAVGLLNNALTNLTVLADRTNVLQLYQDTKEYICCNLRDSSYDMWVAWTVVGCLGFVLALLASGVVVRAARERRRRLKLPPGDPAALGGAALWAPNGSGGARYSQNRGAPPPPTAPTGPISASDVAGGYSYPNAAYTTNGAGYKGDAYKASSGSEMAGELAPPPAQAMPPHLPPQQHQQPYGYGSTDPAFAMAPVRGSGRDDGTGSAGAFV